LGKRGKTAIPLAPGAGLYWGSGYSRIVDDGDLRICTDDNLHFNTGCNSSSLGTERMVLLANGSLGIGKNPGYPLDVAGTARADSFESDAEFKTVYSTVVKHGGVLAMDQYTWRRVVPQRFSGFIVWTPVANDHAAAAYRVVNNSNAGAGSRDWRVQNDYYSDARYITSRYNGGWLEFSKAGTSPSVSNPHMYHVTIYGAII
jgi:hypothetical protein